MSAPRRRPEIAVLFGKRPLRAVAEAPQARAVPWPERVVPYLRAQPPPEPQCRRHPQQSLLRQLLEGGV